MTDNLFRAHTLACTCGSRIAGTPFARFMDRILNHGATKRANELLAARADHEAEMAAYRRAIARRDTRAQGEIWPRLKATKSALLRAESGVGVRR